MAKSHTRKKRVPKRVLALPDLEHAKSAVLTSLTSASGKRTYDHAITEFVGWYCSEPRLAFNRTVVLRYRIHLEERPYAPATINLRLAAVRRLAYEAADAGLLSPELAAGIRRVKGVRRLGIRMGNWLTAEQGGRLLRSEGPMSLRATRDHAMIAMLIGCGLRRGELLALTVESVHQREEHWVIADLLGKAGHVRTVPIPLAYAKACGRNLVVYGRPAKQSQPGAEVLVAWSSVVASWTPLPEFRLVPIAVEDYMDASIGVLQYDVNKPSTAYSPREIINWVANTEGVSHFNYDMRKKPVHQRLKGLLDLGAGAGDDKHLRAILHQIGVWTLHAIDDVVPKEPPLIYDERANA